MTDYEQIENIVAEALKNDIFDVKPLPDNESGFNRSFVKPIVYISFTGSEFSEPELNSLVSQEENISFEAIIRSKTRRGKDGIYSIARYICENIQGRKISVGFDKIQLVHHGFIEASNNDWNYVVTFKTLTHCSSKYEDEEDDVYLLKRPEFKERGPSYDDSYNKSYN